MRKGLVLAMEDDSSNLENGDDSIAEMQAEVESGVSENDAEVGQVDELVTSIEDAIVDADALGDIQEVVADKVEDGEGLSPEAAQIAEIAVEAICARLGMNSSKVMPAMESFGSSNSRVTATRIAMENIGDTIKKVWEAIKKAFKSVWQKITDWFSKFFANSDKVKAYAEALRKQATELGDKVMDAKEIDNKSVASAFVVKKASGLGSLNIVLKNHEAITSSALETFSVIQKAVSFVTDSVKDVSKFSRDDGIALTNSITDGLKKNSVTVTEDKNKKGDTFTTKIGPFVNSQLVVVVTSDDAKNPTIKVSTETGESASDSKLKTLTQTEMTAVCDTVINLMKLTENYKKKQKDIESVNSAFVKLTDAAITFADKMVDSAENNSDAKTKISAIRVLATDFNSLATRMTTMMPTMNVQAGRAACAYVKASLAQYGDKKK